MISVLNIPPGAFVHLKRIFPEYKYDLFYAAVAGIGFGIVGLLPGYHLVGAVLMLIPALPIMWRLYHDTEKYFWQEIDQSCIDGFEVVYLTEGRKLGFSEEECYNDMLAVKNCYDDRDAEGLLICMAAIGEKLAVVKKSQEENSSVAEIQHSDESLESMMQRLKEVNAAIEVEERKLEKSSRFTRTKKASR